jgi:hypothetical protein
MSSASAYEDLWPSVYEIPIVTPSVYPLDRIITGLLFSSPDAQALAFSNSLAGVVCIV